jgi:DNA-binding transcriptional LysR family regulator
MTKNLSSLDLNLLVLLEALFDERNITRAAARLGIGQPSASKALDRLRISFKDELFVRTPDGMRPTTRALSVEASVRHALAEIRKIVIDREKFDPSTITGIVRIATSDTVTLTTLPDVLRRLHRKVPGLEVHIRNLEKDNAFSDLDSGRLNFVIGVFDNVPKRFLAKSVIDDHFVVIAPASIKPERGKIALKTYLELPHILFTLRDDSQGAIDLVLAKRGLKRRVGITVCHVLAIPALVASTGFVSTISAQIAKRIGPTEGCKIFEPPFALQPWKQQLVWSQETDSNPLLALVRDELLTPLAKK